MATEIVVFDVAGLRCGLCRADVLGLLPLAELWRPPGAPPALLGFLNLGGSPLPVIEMAALLGRSSSEAGLYSHLIRVRTGVAFIVDRVTDLVAAEMRAVADGETLNGSVAGEAEVGGALVHVLALDRLLLAHERHRLAALTEAAAARRLEWSAS